MLEQDAESYPSKPPDLISAGWEVQLVDSWKWTEHASYRWAQRFPSLEPSFELRFAERATRRQKAQIRKQCPWAGSYLDRRRRPGQRVKSAARDAMISPGGVVFIIDFAHRILTVLPLADSPSS